MGPKPTNSVPVRTPDAGAVAQRVVGPDVNQQPEVAQKPETIVPERAPAPVGKRVTLVLQSRPNALVYRGKKRLGKTPYRLVGKPGEYFVLKLRAKGFRAHTVELTLANEAKQSFSVKLKKSRRVRRRKVKSKGPFDIEDPI